jgi:hypothetical protein
MREIFDKPYTLKEYAIGALKGLGIVCAFVVVIAVLFYIHIELGEKLLN